MEDEIRVLKSRKNAVILAHNYQPMEIQALADVVGEQPGTCGEGKRDRG